MSPYEKVAVEQKLDMANEFPKNRPVIAEISQTL